MTRHAEGKEEQVVGVVKVRGEVSKLTMNNLARSTISMEVTGENSETKKKLRGDTGGDVNRMVTKLWSAFSR